MRFIARWDLDKTYLRTDFDTVRDLVRTAIERPDQKRTVPGAASLLRELGREGVETHILSGSPEQLRSRIEDKLRLDGARWASLTLKPNLQNLLRLRFRALRGQLGYKLPALLYRRCEPSTQRDEQGELVREVLLGDDAEADAFVYSLYADVCAGRVSDETLGVVMRRGGAYDDTVLDAVRYAGYVEKGDVVERILIHLDRQSSPSDFRIYGPRVVPFYNYLQAAFVLHEDGRIPARSVLKVAQNLVGAHNFDGGALARSYLDLSRRAHVSGRGIPELSRELGGLVAQRRAAGASELGAMVGELERMLPELAPPVPRQSPGYRLRRARREPQPTPTPTGGPLTRSALALALMMGAGCTLGGTIDNIPKKDPVRLTEVKVRPPNAGCPDREAQVGQCRLSGIQCAYDEKGCEVCVCESR